MAPARSVVALGAIACAASAAAPAQAAASSVEEQLTDAVNEYRAGHGLRPLRAAESLDRTSDRAARRILRTDEVRHSRPINRRFSRTGENLAWQEGRARDARQVVQMWAESDAHRAILLRDDVRWIGAGRECGELNGRRTTVWVLQVGGR